MQKSGKIMRWARTASPALRRWGPARWLCAGLGCALLLGSLAAGYFRVHAQSSVPLPAIDLPRPAHPAAAGQKSDQTAAPNTPEKREIASECSDLLKMATDLKSEVDKTNQDTLSVAVVRKAGEIEQYAHKVRLGPARTGVTADNMAPGR
jgi:hypothetical protein